MTRTLSTLCAALLLATLSVGGAHAQTKPVLTVYTYASFTGKYGPGGVVKARFEAECGCELVWAASDDAGSLLGRLRLEGEATKADVVLGLDMNLMAEAKVTGLFAPHGQDAKGLALPRAWDDDSFVPFDWSGLAFVYDSTKLANPPTSLKALVETSSATVLLQDPRTSAPGLGFLLWMRKVFGDEAPGAWAKLKPRIVTVTKGWSEAYGLFLKGEADMVLSYVTSPAYHAGVEKKTQYKAAPFAEGQYLHVEIAGATKVAKDPALARRFLAFVLSEPFQSAMPEGNWMLPARMPSAGLPASFEFVTKPERVLSYTPEEVSRDRRAFVNEWLNAAAR